MLSGIIGAVKAVAQTITDTVKIVAQYFKTQKAVKNAKKVISKARSIKASHRVLTDESVKTVRKMRKRLKPLLTAEEIKSAGSVTDAILQISEKELARRAGKNFIRNAVRNTAQKVGTAAKNKVLSATGLDKYIDISKAVRSGDIKKIAKVWARDFAPQKVRDVFNAMSATQNAVKGLSTTSADCMESARAQLGVKATDEEVHKLATQMARAVRAQMATNLLARFAKLPLDSQTRSAINDLKRIKGGAIATKEAIEKILKILNYKWEDVEGRKKRLVAPSEYNQMIINAIREGIEDKQASEKKKVRQTVETEKPEKPEENPDVSNEYEPPTTDTNAMSWEAETGHLGKERSFAIDKYRFVKQGDKWIVYYNYRKKKGRNGFKYFVPHPKQYSIAGLDEATARWLDTSSSKGRAFHNLLKGVVSKGDMSTLNKEKLMAYFTEHPRAKRNISIIQRRKESVQRLLETEKERVKQIQSRFDNGELSPSHYKSQMDAVKKHMAIHKNALDLANEIALEQRRRISGAQNGTMWEVRADD